MLDDKLSIETPEQIQLEFPLAGIGTRFLALAWDTAIQFLAAALLVLAGVGLGVWTRWQPGEIWLAAILILFVFLIQFGYFAFFEAIWRGQTPGKRRLYLRVIKDTGQPITTFDAVARNLLRIVDSFPTFYAVGIISALLSPQNKRLGDYVAGTVVVYEKPLEQQAAPEYNAPEVASGYDVAQLSPEEFQVIEAYLLRRAQLDPQVRVTLARQLVERLSPKLSIPSADQQHPEPLFEKLVTDYRNRFRFR